ncbi:glutamate-cysteine ligase family protein [Tistrella mobilis]
MTLEHLPMPRSPKVGVEIELPVASAADGSSLAVPDVFTRLVAEGEAQGRSPQPLCLGGRVVGLRDAAGMISVDNGFNNLEASLGPVSGLERLDDEAHEALDRIGAAVTAAGGMLVNLAEHPFQPVSRLFYLATRAPKPVYDYWNEVRGWDHAAGIDAKAHNSPSTDVPVDRGADAVNLVLGFSAAFIALFANSPYENGRATGFRENRLTLWSRMCGKAHAARDRSCFVPPAEPFAGLAAYMRWALGVDVPLPALPHGPADLAPTSKIGGLVEVEGQPTLREFLGQGRSWSGRLRGGDMVVQIRPSATHFAALQSSNFLDARLRFAFAPGRMPEPATLAAAIDNDAALARLMAETTSAVYLEGRAPGANLPDQELIDLGGEAVAASVVSAAGALQKGLLAMMDRGLAVIARHGWAQLMLLRERAMRDGLAARVDGLTAAHLAAELVDLAGAGLDAREARFLAYPAFVLETGQSGADRAIAMVEAGHDDMAARLTRLVFARRHVALGGAAPGASAAAGAGQRSILR